MCENPVGGIRDAGRNSSHNCAKRIGNATETGARMCTIAVATYAHVRTEREKYA